ncbi:MAG TPA: hypothetical protein VK422_18720 [Pyrinomonadaceae bacterium]|nr:hypothetical protein [Pyrinomonadaceae bacterium]
MGFEGKSRRLRERIKLALPVRVRSREAQGREWVEMTRLVDVTPFGAKFTLTHATERGRLLHLTLSMPRQLRCFDHIEDQYRIWALVRHVKPFTAAGAEPGVGAPLRYEIGAAFIGKNPPASYLNDPSTRYEVSQLSAENMWEVREEDEQKGEQAARSYETRLHMAINVTVEVFGDEGQVEAREQTVTENISRRGAAVWTTLEVERGRFVRMTNVETGMSLMAAVRGNRRGPDGIPRLHLEFIDRQWPLEGIE